MKYNGLVILTLLIVRAASIEDVLNECIDGRHHKTVPGPESELFQACQPWKDRACCTNETSYLSHQDGPENLYNFNYDHCAADTGVPMSAKCRTKFQENNCFYECSPNTGPWMVESNLTYRNEKFQNIPLCESSCLTWFEACADDYTCKVNWNKGWNFDSGINECPEGSTCQKFRDLFLNHVEFCQSIYEKDFVVVDDDTKPCMVLWFEGENPNDEVAEYYAKEMGLCCGASALQRSWILATFTTLMLSYLNKLF